MNPMKTIGGGGRDIFVPSLFLLPSCVLESGYGRKRWRYGLVERGVWGVAAASEQLVLVWIDSEVVRGGVGSELSEDTPRRGAGKVWRG